MEKEVLLITGNYPHDLLQHMNTLVKEEGRSCLWDESFVRLFGDKFPELKQEINILDEAYRLKIPERFQMADRQAAWSKRACITQSLFVLVQNMKEYEAVMFVESLMCLLEWDVQVSVERKWEAREEDRARFNEEEYQKASGQLDSVLHGETTGAVQTGIETLGQSAGMERAALEGSPEEQQAALVADISGLGSKALSSGDNLQESGREIKFLAQMNFAMKREASRAVKGNADSQQKLGGFYAEEGTKHLDYHEAVYWYQLSARQGNYKSQMELGRIFDSGKIGDSDSKSQGIYWYRKLAEDGFPTAQCILGAKYLWGDGVEENKREAVYWFKKAAAQGHEEAIGYLSGLIKMDIPPS